MAFAQTNRYIAVTSVTNGLTQEGAEGGRRACMEHGMRSAASSGHKGPVQGQTVQRLTGVMQVCRVTLLKAVIQRGFVAGTVAARRGLLWCGGQDAQTCVQTSAPARRASLFSRHAAPPYAAGDRRGPAHSSPRSPSDSDTQGLSSGRCRVPLW